MTLLPGKYRSKLLVVPVVLALGMALATGCGNSNAAKKARGDKGRDDHEGHGHDGDAKKPRGAAAGAKSVRPVHLSAAQQKEFGIQVAVAKPGTLKMKLALTGEVTLNPNHVAHLVPSISGAPKRVLKQLGDPVKKGELMPDPASR